MAFYGPSANLTSTTGSKIFKAGHPASSCTRAGVSRPEYTGSTVALGLIKAQRAGRVGSVSKEIAAPILVSDPDLDRKQLLNAEKVYIEQFFVGLLEGDGTITTNISTSKKIRVRIVIALKNETNNLDMLKKIQNIVGGRVVIERKDKYVTWIAANKIDVNKILSILYRYPFLTVRKQCQLEFAKSCFLYKDYKDVENFMLNRNNMYKSAAKKDLLIKLNNAEYTEPQALPLYFAPWLSGFIEAEGNFSLIFNEKGGLRKSAFAIGQNDELHILKMIKTYFQSNNQILKDKKKLTPKGIPSEFDYYRLYLYNALSRKLLFEHFEKYPLLGHKKVSYQKFYNYQLQCGRR